MRTMLDTLDCARGDVADELTFFDELLELFKHRALQGRRFGEAKKRK
jgi:hypothetical protein